MTKEQKRIHKAVYVSGQAGFYTVHTDGSFGLNPTLNVFDYKLACAIAKAIRERLEVC